MMMPSAPLSFTSRAVADAVLAGKAQAGEVVSADEFVEVRTEAEAAPAAEAGEAPAEAAQAPPRLRRSRPRWRPRLKRPILVRVAGSRCLLKRLKPRLPEFDEARIARCVITGPSGPYY